MQGTVENLQALVSVPFRFPNRPDIAIEFVVDTGFVGALTLPQLAVDALGFPFHTNIEAHLADGTIVRVDAYAAVIVWDGNELPVAVLAMGTRPLLGTALLNGHILEADYSEGGSVLIRPK